jgi:ribosomal protein RSM22 (predicted rRNA methylase)
VRTKLPPSIEPAWIELVDRVAPTVLGRDDRRGEALAREVKLVSELYTRERASLHRTAVELAARLRFFLLRDLPKISRPLVELGFPHRSTMRVLDLGAGLGTSTLGVARATKKHAVADALDVLAIEREPRLVDVMRTLCARAGEIATPIRLETREHDLERLDPSSLGSGFDLIVVGLALNELFVDAPDPIGARTAWCESMARTLADDGAMIVIEPALRTTTRALMEVRERLVANRTLRVVAPCTADGACPLLRRERDWCHADDALALPEPLASIARAAGLRFEGLSYAYLSLRRASLSREPAHRVVGGPIVQKGRTEWHLCRAPSLVRLSVLHRDRDETDRLASLGRGDLVIVDPAPEGDAPLRVGKDASVHRIE